MDPLVIESVEPVGGHVSSAHTITVDGSGFESTPIVDVDSGKITLEPRLHVWLEASGGGRVDIANVTVYDGGRRLELEVPADIAGGLYDVVIENASGDQALGVGEWAAADATGARFDDVSAPVPQVSGTVRLVNAMDQPARLSLDDYDLVLSTDSTDITLSTTAVTLGTQALSAPVTLDSTLAHTAQGIVTIQSTSTGAFPLETPTATFEFLPGPAAQIVVSDMTTMNLQPADIPVTVVDQWNNPQGNHGGLNVDWIIEQSQHPNIPEKPAGPTATLVFGDGVSELTINLDPQSTPGEVEVGLEPASLPLDRCFGLVCFGGVGCGTLVATGCVPP